MLDVMSVETCSTDMTVEQSNMFRAATKNPNASDLNKN